MTTERHRYARRRAATPGREELLRATAACICERGFELTRLRDVAQRAGVSIGLLQHYFTTRGDLLAEAFHWSCEELMERWRQQVAATSDHPWERVAKLIEELTAEPSLVGHATLWVEFCASSARHPELRSAVAEVFAAWRSHILTAIEDGREQGELRPELDPRDIADTLNALVDGFEMATAVDAELVTPERFRGLVLGAAHRLMCPTAAAVAAAGGSHDPS